jgi:hypothetical protein
MNTIEDRLRDALRERAAQSPIDPDAWARTVTRSRRRPGRVPGWTRYMIPLAAAAAVVAIVVGATELTGGPRGGSGATGTSASASPSAVGAPAPPGPGDSLIKGTTVLSAIIPVKLTAGQQTTWTFVWFSRPDSGSDRDIQLCSITDGAGYDGSGGCQPPVLEAGQGYAGGVDPVRTIATDKQVTSATALLPHGRSVSGVLAFGRGFPDKVWLVQFPEEDSATVVLRNAAGQVVKRISYRGQYPALSQPRSGGIKLFSYPAKSASPTAGTMTAYLLNGSLVGVTGKVVGFWSSGPDSSFSTSNVPASGPPAVSNFGGDGGYSGATVAEYYGYAHANVARVVLRLQDGKQYSAQTTAAWPGSGLRLWHFAVPIKPATAPGKQVMLGYNAAGQVVSQQTLPSGG